MEGALSRRDRFGGELFFFELRLVDAGVDIPFTSCHPLKVQERSIEAKENQTKPVAKELPEHGPIGF